MFAPNSHKGSLAQALRRYSHGVRAYLRILNGDAAYTQYLAHWRAVHAEAGAPLSRAEFFKTELARRWDGIRRCC